MSVLSPYHQRLPYGERVPADPLLGNPFFPFDGALQVRPLEEPVLPEPPRAGEPGGKPCPNCPTPGSPAARDEFVIWRDDKWSVLAGMEPAGVPMVALLISRKHYRLDNLPPELAADLGPMIQRMSAAIRRIEGVGRTHLSRYGDGSEHFHLWFFARPLGQMQLRGPSLQFWESLLPPVPTEEFRTNTQTLATALTEHSGKAL